MNKEFNVFVENRIKEIRKLTDMNSWHYVETRKNPADLITRMDIVSFAHNQLWWGGPEFLHGDKIIATSPDPVTDTPSIESKSQTTPCLSEYENIVDTTFY